LRSNVSCRQSERWLLVADVDGAGTISVSMDGKA
jgi:hypothetical protein